MDWGWGWRVDRLSYYPAVSGVTSKIRLRTAGGHVPRSGEPVLVTIGAGRRRFICHVCEGTVFSGFNVKLNTAVGYRLGAEFAEDSISLVCSDCRYVHTFFPGAVQVWEVKDGYPEDSK